MATQLKPKVFHLATTKVVPEAQDYLDHIGAGDWTTDAEDDASRLVEIAGRSCYMSFGTDINKNVTRTRKGNHDYVGQGILRTKHGSVLEHAYDTFALVGVSRIVTHEMVRHSIGTRYSQESGRFVRIDDLKYYMPEALGDEYLRDVYHDLVEAGHVSEDFEWWVQGVRGRFIDGMHEAEAASLGLERELGLDHLRDFGKKKTLQSAIRRIAPNGMLNTIVMTGNHRAWRHIVASRTDAHAEEEIRLVVYQVFERLRELHPAIYQDAMIDRDVPALPSDVPVVSFLNEKV